MILEQFYLGCLSHASYLIADEETKETLVVDPQRDINQYLDYAEMHALDIKHVILTHLHADFIAGHLELQESTGAKIYLSHKAEAEYEFVPLKENDELKFGDVKLKILETPGHSPESISILVFDMDKDSDIPYAILTGDTLFIGDVGRPDLRASLGWTAKELGEMLYESVHNKLLKIPDQTLVYPAHGAGSMCGKNLSSETVSTMGVQKKYNYALQPMSKEEFVDVVTADQPDAPEYFTYNAVLNTKDRPTLEESIDETLNPLSVEQVIKLRDDGAQILDVRNQVEYEGAHLKGTVNIGLDGKFATWVGTLLDENKPIVVIAKPENIEEAYIRLGRIGYDKIAGFLSGGMESLAGRNDLFEKTERITPLSLSDILSDGHTTVIDIRTEKEWESGHIRGSKNIPLNHLDERLEEINNDDIKVFYCQSGYRSSIACSLAEIHNVSKVYNLVGGFSAWKTSKLSN